LKVLTSSRPNSVISRIKRRNGALNSIRELLFPSNLEERGTDTLSNTALKPGKLKLASGRKQEELRGTRPKLKA